MSQETANGTPQKSTREQWISLGCVLVMFVCIIVTSLRGTGPPNPVSLEGTIVILDENGEVMPYRETIFTFYSHYAPGFFRSEMDRKRNLYINESGFGNPIPIKIPKSAATLFSNSGSKTLAFRRFYVYNMFYGSLSPYLSYTV